MQRLFTKVADGSSPNGRWFAGDVNALQDAVAALMDLTQTLGIGNVQVGESGLQILRYGAGEMRITGMLRTDGIVRALGGLYCGAYTTTERNALVLPPYGLVLTNTTVNRLQWNAGTPSVPVWQDLGYVAPDTITALEIAAATITDVEVAAANKDGADNTYSLRRLGTTAGRAAAGTHGPQHSLAGADPLPTDSVAAAQVQNGTLTDAEIASANKDGAAGTPSMRTIGAGATQVVAGNDARLTDQRTPLDNSVNATKIIAGHGGADDYGSALPGSGLFNGYRFTLFVANPVGGQVAFDCIYRADLDGTYPWHVQGGGTLASSGSLDFAYNNVYANVSAALTIPNSGWWDVHVVADAQSNIDSGNAMVRLLIGGADQGELTAGGQPANKNATHVWSREFAIGATATLQGQGRSWHYDWTGSCVFYYKARPVKII